MAFFARAVSAPPDFRRHNPLKPVSLDDVDAPQLAEYGYSPLARPALVFVERVRQPATEPILPDGLEHGATPEGEKLFWALVTTDSCEAAHCGALLTLRALVLERGVEVIDDTSGEVVRDFGMLNALRVRPFVRHVMVDRSAVRVVGTSSSGKPRIAFDEQHMPRVPSQGGAMHQLICLRTATGREILMDFTGPQYGVDERLPLTNSPCWRCDVGGEVARGFELTGGVASFSDPRGVHEGVLNNQMHAYIANWVKDSALGVLAHRSAKGLPLQ